MVRKLFCWLMILVAVVLAILGVTLPRTSLQPIIIITNFFDIMIPALAVGALINYLWKSHHCCCNKDKKEE